MVGPAKEGLKPIFLILLQKIEEEGIIPSSFCEANITLKQKPLKEDFTGGSVVKNPSANAGNTGSTPGLGRCRMLEQLSLHATIQLLNLCSNKV